MTGPSFQLQKLCFVHTFIYFRVYCEPPCMCPESGMTAEDNTWEWVLSFYHEGPEDHTEVVRLCVKSLYLLSHPANSE